MHVSDAGLAFIGHEEGTVLHVYKDVAGIPTVGVGHVLRPGESFPNGITYQQAMDLLRHDIQTAESGVETRVIAPLTQNQFDALCSFVFNCGAGALAQSSLLKLINSGQSGDANAITTAFSLWSKRKDPKTGALVVDQVLWGRRHREAALFLTPDTAAAVVVPPPVPQPAPPTDPVAPAPTPDPAAEQPVAPAPIVVASSQPSVWSAVFSALKWLFQLFFKR